MHEGLLLLRLGILLGVGLLGCLRDRWVAVLLLFGTHYLVSDM